MNVPNSRQCWGHIVSPYAPIPTDSQSTSSSTSLTCAPWFSCSSPLFHIACHLPTCISGRPGMSLWTGTAFSFQKIAIEHVMAAVDVAVAGCVNGAKRHPTLPEDGGEESTETRGESEGVGALVKSVKREGCEASSTGRRDTVCARG